VCILSCGSVCRSCVTVIARSASTHTALVSHRADHIRVSLKSVSRVVGGVPSFSDPAVFLSELLCLNARAQKRILSIGLYALGLFDLLCGSRMASAVYREEASRVSTRT